MSAPIVIRTFVYSNAPIVAGPGATKLQVILLGMPADNPELFAGEKAHTGLTLDNPKPELAAQLALGGRYKITIEPEA